ncbi:MAG TPA: MltR family transcriptional regulator [Thermoanaerobaculia bacterium]|nr:MltR family transcriptional regulator [Thermoanaerobaculia bacterium]
MAEPLPIPDEVLKDDSLAEVLRVWKGPDGRVYVSWDDKQEGGSEAVGVVLGAVANVIAAHAGEAARDAARKAMTQGFRQAARAFIPDHVETFPKLFEYNDIVEAYHNESDRAAGILSAAWLDNYLGQCLRYFLVQDAETVKLVGGDKQTDRPLSPFKVRARALFSLGLMSKDALADVSLIVSVRNHFAHHPSVTSFDDEQIKSWCNGLRAAKMKMGENARLNFLFATSWVAIELNNALGQAHTIEMAPDINSDSAAVKKERVKPPTS